MEAKSEDVLLSLHYLPNVQFLSAISCFSAIYIEQWEHYQKISFRNRCFIGTAQGALQLSVPLLSGKHEQQPIRQTQIDNSQPWQRLHWRSIKTAYGSAPFWEFYSDELEGFYTQKYELLWDWNWALLQWLLRKFKIDKPLLLTNEYQPQNAALQTDMRQLISPKNYQQPQEAGFTARSYPQPFGDRQAFLPNLSGLDLLFCVGNQSKNYLQSCRF